MKNETTHISIAAACKYAREQASLSHTALRMQILRDTGRATSSQQLLRWESGEYEPTISSLLSIAQVCQVRFVLNNNGTVSTFE